MDSKIKWVARQNGAEIWSSFDIVSTNAGAWTRKGDRAILEFQLPENIDYASDITIDAEVWTTTATGDVRCRTTAAPITIEATTLPCGDKLISEAFKFTSVSTLNTVCGATQVNGKCPGSKKKTYTEAKFICAKVGARLCSVAELDADVTKGTGCGLDVGAKGIWTRDTGCGTGMAKASKGSSDEKATYNTQCIPISNTGTHVRCCAMANGISDEDVGHVCTNPEGCDSFKLSDVFDKLPPPSDDYDYYGNEADNYAGGPDVDETLMLCETAKFTKASGAAGCERIPEYKETCIEALNSAVDLACDTSSSSSLSDIDATIQSALYPSWFGFNSPGSTTAQWITTVFVIFIFLVVAYTSWKILARDRDTVSPAGRASSGDVAAPAPMQVAVTQDNWMADLALAAETAAAENNQVSVNIPQATSSRGGGGGGGHAAPPLALQPRQGSLFESRPAPAKAAAKGAPTQTSKPKVSQWGPSMPPLRADRASGISGQSLPFPNNVSAELSPTGWNKANQVSFSQAHGAPPFPAETDGSDDEDELGFPGGGAAEQVTSIAFPGVPDGTSPAAQKTLSARSIAFPGGAHRWSSLPEETAVDVQPPAMPHSSPWETARMLVPSLDPSIGSVAAMLSVPKNLSPHARMSKML